MEEMLPARSVEIRKEGKRASDVGILRGAKDVPPMRGLCRLQDVLKLGFGNLAPVGRLGNEVGDAIDDRPEPSARHAAAFVVRTAEAAGAPWTCPLRARLFPASRR